MAKETDMALQTERPRRLFSVDDYHRMADAGIFGPDERVELIDGEIIEMSPIGPRHAGCVINLNRLLFTRLGERAVISPQNPVTIRPRSEPQPDMLVLRPREISYSRAHPTPEDVLLAVEVAATSLRFDRRKKVPLYARHGIPEMWLLDVEGRRFVRYRAPQQGSYMLVDEPDLGTPLELPALSGVVVDLHRVFG